MTAPDVYDVAVVGFGPAGEVAAATLGLAGHRVAVFERQRELYPLPRMVTFDGEACRTVQATGESIDDALSTAVVLDSCSFGDADADPMLVLDWTGVQGGFAAHNSIFRRGDDVLGHGFQLVCRTDPGLSEQQSAALASIGCSIAVLDDTGNSNHVEDVDGVYLQFLDAAATDAYLMRPDWYIFGTSHTDGIGELVDELARLLHLEVDTRHEPTFA